VQTKKVSILRKITVRDVAGKFNARAIPEQGGLDLIKVYGQVIDAEVKSTDKGDYLLFSGAIKAEALTGALAGRVFASGKLILPNVAADFLYGAVARAQGGSVEFAFRLSAELDDSAVTGYVYRVEPLIEGMGDEVFRSIESRIAGNEPLKLSPEAPPASNPAHGDPAHGDAVKDAGKAGAKGSKVAA
jgi:hypothetical protein